MTTDQRPQLRQPAGHTRWTNAAYRRALQLQAEVARASLMALLGGPYDPDAFDALILDHRAAVLEASLAGATGRLRGGSPAHAIVVGSAQ